MIYADGGNPNLPEYEFYAGTERLRFDQGDWRYYRVLPDGVEPLCGVTGVLHKVLDRSEPLMKWAVKRALEKTKRLCLRYCRDDGNLDLNVEELDLILDEAKTADREEKEAAADTGHEAHEWIEQVIKAILVGADGRRIELLGKLPLDPRAANCCIAAVEWMDAHNVRWIATERKIYSRKFGYAGTMDGLALVSSCTDPACCPTPFVDRLTLVDWKTSNYLYIEYLLQSAAYKQAYEEETGEKIEDRWIIRLGKDDAEFDPWHVSKESEHVEDLDAWLKALALYKSVLNIEDRVTEMKAARRAAEKARIAAERKIKCLKADEYQGVRKKKGCNDTEELCDTCRQKWEAKHGTESKS